MKKLTQYIQEKLHPSQFKDNKLDINDFKKSDKQIPKKIKDLEDSLFWWVDSHTKWSNEQDVIDYLSDEGLVEWADQENISHDIIGSMIHDFKPDIITYWVHKWFVENNE